MRPGIDWIQYGAGMVYMKHQRYKAAENVFQKIIINSSSYGNAYVQLGILNKIRERGDDAETCFNKALELDPQNEEANLQLA